jgi:hypothetical protein
MSLVSDATMKKLTDKSGFIYKNFAYIYQNPLWKKKTVPEGFWICPYFWMALLVGFFFMRLFFVPVMLGLGQIIKVFPFLNGLYNRALATGLNKCNIIDDGDTEKLKTSESVNGLVITAITVGVVGALLGLIIILYNFCATQGPVIVSGFLAAKHPQTLAVHGVILLMTVIGCTIINVLKSDSNCKPWAYLKMVLLVLVAHNLYFVGPTIWGWLVGFWFWMGDAIPTAWTATIGFISTAWTATCGFVVDMVTYDIFGMQAWLAVLLFLAVMYLIGFGSPKLIDAYFKMLDKRWENEKKELKKKKSTADDWYELLGDILVDRRGDTHEILDWAEDMVDSFYYNKKYKSEFHKRHKKIMTQNLVRFMIKKFMSVPCLMIGDMSMVVCSRKLWEEYRSKKKADAYFIAKTIVGHIESESLQERFIDNFDKFFSIIRKIAHRKNAKNIKTVNNWLKKEHAQSLDVLKLMEGKWEIREETKKKRKVAMNKACEETTGTLAATFAFLVTRPLAWTWKAVKTVLWLIFVFLKMRKQKLCPYVEFHDGNDKSEKKA